LVNVNVHRLIVESPSLPTKVIPERGVVRVTVTISTFWGPGHIFGVDEARRFKFGLQVERSWWRGTVVERRSLAGELSLSCARPVADG